MLKCYYYTNGSAVAAAQVSRFTGICYRAPGPHYHTKTHVHITRAGGQMARPAAESTLKYLYKIGSPDPTSKFRLNLRINYNLIIIIITEKI